MKQPHVKLNGSITIQGAKDEYTIFEKYPVLLGKRFITQSKNGYTDEGTNGHKSLLVAIQVVYEMIKDEK